MNTNRFAREFLSMALLVGGASVALAQDANLPDIRWTATDTRGAAIAVPAKDKPSVLVFARLDQQTSTEALEHVKAIADKISLNVLVILSGDSAAASARTFQESGKYPWPVVVDPKFETSGNMGVHVWPTVLVVKANGQQLAHLAGMPPTFAADLNNYMEFAGARIDEATLKQRLTTRETVTDTDEQKAARHLQVARRLLDAADVRGASSEIEAGVKLQPGNPNLLLLQARVLVLNKHHAEALQSLAKIPAGALPAWQTSEVKAWALVGLDKWADAKALVGEITRLNPLPADAYYLTGLIHQHDGDAVKAAEAFRKAYESGSDGRRLLAAQDGVK